MIQRIFRRKIYDKILKWKEENQGKTALLIEGARRVGKSTVVEEFARKEYQSCIIIDFNKARKEVKDLFEDLMDIDLLFLKLQQTYHVELVDRNSVIVFDEVQMHDVERADMQERALLVKLEIPDDPELDELVKPSDQRDHDQ